MACALALCLAATMPASSGPEKQNAARRVVSTAYAIPKHTTNQNSGYFSIVSGHNKRLYIGTAKYGENAFLVEFNTQTLCEQINGMRSGTMPGSDNAGQQWP